MKKTNINFPHPVLSNLGDDYINSSFDIFISDSTAIVGDVVKIDVRYELNSTGLEELIQKEKAKVVVRLESPLAEYREVFNFDIVSKELEVKINKDLLNKTLKVNSFIIASEAINGFRLDEHNTEIFGSVPFNIRKGDILAVYENEFQINLNNYDPLADKPSIFSIRRNTAANAQEISIDISTPKISILLNDSLYNQYKALYEAPDDRILLSTFFVAPVLVDVLSMMQHFSKEERVDYEEKKWFQVIDSRLKEMNINIGDPSNCESLTAIANKILPHIFESYMKSLKSLCDTFLKDGEEK